MRRKPKFFRAPDGGTGTGTGTGTDNGTDKGTGAEPSDRTHQLEEQVRQLEGQVKQLQSDLARATVNNRNQSTDPERTPDEIVMAGLSAWAANNYDPARLAE